MSMTIRTAFELRTLLHARLVQWVAVCAVRCRFALAEYLNVLRADSIRKLLVASWCAGFLGQARCFGGGFLVPWFVQMLLACLFFELAPCSMYERFGLCHCRACRSVSPICLRMGTVHAFVWLAVLSRRSSEGCSHRMVVIIVCYGVGHMVNVTRRW